MRDSLTLLARKGLTDEEMAIGAGINPQTLYNFKKRYQKFFESINDWKKAADQEVERSLYERACGYSHLQSIGWARSPFRVQPFRIGRRDARRAGHETI